MIFPGDEFVYVSDFLNCYNDDEDDFGDLCLGYCTPKDLAEILNNVACLTENDMKRILDLKHKRQHEIELFNENDA